MSRAEKFIQEYTNHCSNIIINNTQFGGVEETQPWLTPDQARRAVELAREEMLENEHEKSWRLDEKLWKGIKDIEEASYQYMYDASNDWTYDIPTWNDVQDAFKAGSEWKEGLELSWKDIKEICVQSVLVEVDLGRLVSDERHYTEVLKRFKNYKERKEK